MMNVYRFALANLTLQLEGFAYLFAAMPFVYVVVIGGDVRSDVLPMLTALSTVLVLSFIVGLFVRVRALRPVFRILNTGAEIAPDVLLRIKIRLLTHPARESLTVLVRVLGPMGLLILLFYLMGILTMQRLVVMVIGGIFMIGPLSASFFYFRTEHCLARYLEDPRLRPIIVPAQRYVTVGAFAKTLMVIFSVAMVPVGMGSVFIYLMVNRLIDLHNILWHLLAMSVILTVTMIVATVFFASSLRKTLTNISTAINQVAQGKLGEGAVPQISVDETGAMSTDLNVMLHKLRQVIGDISVASGNVAASSQELSASAEQMSQGATEQSSAMEEASASMEEMAANIRQNTENALKTEQIAVKAGQDTQQAGAAVTKTVHAIQLIAKKVAVIHDIAAQTRMLSLNATIEAGKAQDQGKGFVVVAAEVRKLADESRTAAEGITALADRSVVIARNAGIRLNRLIPDIQRTTELVQDVSAASREQDAGTSQISSAIQQLDQVMQQNVATAEQLAATSEELATQAEQLQQTIAFFNIGDASGDPMVSGQPVQPLPPKKGDPSPARAGIETDSNYSDMGEREIFDMRQLKSNRDTLDDDFEQF